MAEKLGILAGRGDLPKRIVNQCVKEGRPFHIIAFKNQTDEDLVAGHPHDWVRLGAGGKSLEILKAQGVTTLVMAGRIKRPSMAALRPDGWTLKLFAKAGVAAFGDDGLLSKIISTLEDDEGFRFVAPHDILSDLLASKGLYTKTSPDELAQQDVKKAFEMAHAIGELDIGQAVVVQDGLVIAVEAIEGTDKMLERVSEVSREGPGGVLVKAKKPNQERRADLPTIGLATVQNAHKAGLRGIAVEANGALIIDQDAVVSEADKLGLFLMGIN